MAKAAPRQELRGPNSVDVARGTSSSIRVRNACWKSIILAALLLVLFCSCWVVWIAALTIAPTSMANMVMKTSNLDYGEFWRFSKAPGVIVAIGLGGLATASLWYVRVLWKLTWLLASTTASGSLKRSTSRLSSKVHDYTIKLRSFSQSSSDRWGSRWSRRFASRASSVALILLDHESVSRRRMQTAAKMTDLFIQCVFLVQLLEQGMPVPLLTALATIVASNALASSVMFLLPYDNIGQVQILIDTFFNFMIAIVFPVLVLQCSLSSFTFDRRLMDINYRAFPPGYFERLAAVVADPVEVEMIRGTLDSLRIDSVLKIFTRVGTHFALSRRCLSIVELLEAKQYGVLTHPNLYPKKQPLVAAVLVMVSIAVVVYTAGSIYTTDRACRPHVECVQIARRWVFHYEEGSLNRCPCLTLIDRNVAVSTYNEWETPHNRTEKVAQLASAGYLQTLQLVNRLLPYFPDELRRCHNLKHVSLYYTDTLEMPRWFGGFAKLEFLHVEAKAFNKSFQTLPEQLFDKLSKLSYIHLALLGVSKLPSMDGLSGLKSFTLAILPYLSELPSFRNLHALERLTLASILAIKKVPDLARVHHLKALVVGDRGTFCCNGFLGPDKCNLNHSLCRDHPIWGTPAVTQCINSDSFATAKTREYFDKFNNTACYGEALQPNQVKLAPTLGDIAQCNGTMYRECHLPGYNGSAMCYNTRWMAVACDPSPFAIHMRRLQIANGVGLPCNPEYEAWLGCRGH